MEWLFTRMEEYPVVQHLSNACNILWQQTHTPESLDISSVQTFL